MSDLTQASGRPAREFVLGNELRAIILTTAADTDGRHDFTHAVQPADQITPLHLHTRYGERFWVLDGELTIWAGPDRVTLGRATTTPCR